MTSPAKEGEAVGELNLTTVVKATTLKWLEKANGSTDADKFYLYGSQATVESAAVAPKEDSSV